MSHTAPAKLSNKLSIAIALASSGSVKRPTAGDGAHELRPREIWEQFVKQLHERQGSAEVLDIIVYSSDVGS